MRPTSDVVPGSGTSWNRWNRFQSARNHPDCARPNVLISLGSRRWFPVPAYIGGEPRNHLGQSAVIEAIYSAAMSGPGAGDLDARYLGAVSSISAASAQQVSSGEAIYLSALSGGRSSERLSSPGRILGCACCSRQPLVRIWACTGGAHGAIWECGTTIPREELHLAATLEQLRSPVGGNPGPFWALFRKTHPVTGEVNGRGASGSMAMYYCGRHYIRGTVGAHRYALGPESIQGQKLVASAATLPKGVQHDCS